MSKMSVFVVLQVIVALATCSFAQDYENRKLALIETIHCY